MNNIINEYMLLLFKNYNIDPNDQNYVYKLCLNKWLIILQKLPDTITNENRYDINNMKYAKFRANKLKVILIISIINFNTDVTKNIVDTIINYYNNISTQYTVNKIVYSNSFDQNLNNICTTGIHYFKTLKPALYFKKYSNNYSGIWMSWHNNGRIALKMNIINGKKSGKYETWNTNGQYNIIGEYINDNKSGNWIEYYDNGQINYCNFMLNNKIIMNESNEINTANEIDHKLSSVGNNNLLIKSEGNYMEGNKIGHWIYYYCNNHKRKEGSYINGKKCNYWMYWFFTGKISSSGNYVDDEEMGTWIYYYDYTNYIIKKYEGKYFKGEKIGKWLYWNKDEGTCDIVYTS